MAAHVLVQLSSAPVPARGTPPPCSRSAAAAAPAAPAADGARCGQRRGSRTRPDTAQPAMGAGDPLNLAARRLGPIVTAMRPRRSAPRRCDSSSSSPPGLGCLPKPRIGVARRGRVRAKRLVAAVKRGRSSAASRARAPRGGASRSRPAAAAAGCQIQQFQRAQLGAARGASATAPIRRPPPPRLALRRAAIKAMGRSTRARASEPRLENTELASRVALVDGVMSSVRAVHQAKKKKACASEKARPEPSRPPRRHGHGRRGSGSGSRTPPGAGGARGRGDAGDPSVLRPRVSETAALLLTGYAAADRRADLPARTGASSGCQFRSLYRWTTPMLLGVHGAERGRSRLRFMAFGAKGKADANGCGSPSAGWASMRTMIAASGARRRQRIDGEHLATRSWTSARETGGRGDGARSVRRIPRSSLGRPHRSVVVWRIPTPVRRVPSSRYAAAGSREGFERERARSQSCEIGPPTAARARTRKTSPKTSPPAPNRAPETTEPATRD